MRIGSRRWWLLALALLAAGGWGCGSSAGGWSPGQPLPPSVGGYFPAGTALRDGYSGATTTVAADGSVTVQPDPAGVVLLERADAGPGAFAWKNATVYFVVTDRFANGDPSNDAAYPGRGPDGGDEVGTWHGGDWKGLTARLDHIQALGATAIWITPVVEQVHGWVSGGGGVFKHYGYHGYWALDFTRLDANLGAEADLQELVDQAHLRGLRVLVDTVLNHPGYATGEDLLAYLPEVFKDGTGDAFRAFTPQPPRGYDAWNDLVDYRSASWQQWWSPAWIRAGASSGEFPGFTHPGTDDLTRGLDYLPDFITEGTQAAGRPTLFARKAGTGFTAPLLNPDTTGYTVRQYLVKWHSDWVRRLGVDGFRCDTVKHVELASWRALKDASTAALAEWKAANPGKKLDDAPFWMTGEVAPHGVTKDAYFTDGGFDSLINFTFQERLTTLLQGGRALVDGAEVLDALWSDYASRLSADPSFDVLSYVSSHDTRLFADVVGNDLAQQRQAGTALLLTPGGVQVFYGDESGRRAGPTGNQLTQGTRSDMNWSALEDPGSPESGLLAHWKKVAGFRKRHAAVGAGAHQKLASPGGTYAFGRKLPGGDDAVVVVLARPR